MDLITIGVIQLTSKLDPQLNLASIKEIFYSHPMHSSVEFLFLPECFYSLSDGLSPTPYVVKNSSQDPHLNSICELSRMLNVSLVGGSVAFLENNNIYNRALFIHPSRGFIGQYDKNHLFKVNLENSQLDESRIYAKGKNSYCTNLKENSSFKVGFGICFDLRFPDLFRNYFALGCNILSICAAFTPTTGKAHWEILLRARAIENQSFVIASAQVGEHNSRISTYGHSMIIDPWGRIIDQIPQGNKMMVHTLDYSTIKEVKATMNVSNNSH